MALKSANVLSNFRSPFQEEFAHLWINVSILQILFESTRLALKKNKTQFFQKASISFELFLATDQKNKENKTCA